ncbi:hypothetical protein N7461_002869 [Penicillium sp. DV-2018c]|nr:hypothetical protein N7461_002869 [Penicillium sp. DV-2018c]
MKNSLQNASSLFAFLESTVPSTIPLANGQATTREDFIADVKAGLQRAPMATRLTPHILSLIGWNDPYSDPIRRQFIPLASGFQQDHPRLQLDSLNESRDSPVKGLVHRYPDKVLFLGIALLQGYVTSKKWTNDLLSDFGVSRVLPFLHTIILGRDEDGDCDKETVPPSSKVLGADV